MRKILVIDDDSLPRHAYAMTLEDISYENTNVSAGEFGLKEIDENKFDLIFLDLDIPGVNVIETFKQIKKGLQDSGLYNLRFP